MAYEVSNLAPINLLIDTSAVAQKYEVVKIYASQLTESKYMALVKAVDTARTFSLPLDCTAAEGFFRFRMYPERLKSRFWIVSGSFSKAFSTAMRMCVYRLTNLRTSGLLPRRPRLHPRR